MTEQIATLYVETNSVDLSFNANVVKYRVRLVRNVATMRDKMRRKKKRICRLGGTRVLISFVPFSRSRLLNALCRAKVRLIRSSDYANELLPARSRRIAINATTRANKVLHGIRDACIEYLAHRQWFNQSACRPFSYAGHPTACISAYYPSLGIRSLIIARQKTSYLIIAVR